LIGKTISHYRILEKLGEGGMGIVYKAEDTTLKRAVALKFLPPEMTRNPEAKARLLREARAAAALDQPNICTIYEIGEADEQTFIAMALLKGEGLEDKIARGPLKLGQAIDVAAQVAEGLAAAHKRTIVHRDIKPANVMVTTEGQAKIMDFGLAKSVGQTRLTAAHSITGTIAYMSPEQTRGEDVDHRTDIWSCGVTLYEMITGQRPFRGDYDQAVIHSIVNEEPEPMTALRTGVPMQLERIAAKAMAKRPEERYQTVSDMLVDLRAIGRSLEAETTTLTSVRPQPFGAAARRQRRRRILATGAVVVAAVLAGFVWTMTRTPRLHVDPDRVVVAAFENMTGDESLDSIGPMVADWIGQGLSQTGAVDVVSAVTALRTSRAVGAEAGGLHGVAQLRELAGQTGAGTVVSGSYFLEGEDLRFHAKVTNAEDGNLIYAPAAVRGSREAPMKTIETLRQRIMGALVTDFDPSLGSQPPIFEAYREYIVGLGLLFEGRPEAIYLFGRAAAIDSTFMPPRLFVVGAYADQGEWAKADSMLRLLDGNREKLGRLDLLAVDFNLARVQGNHEEGLRILREMVTLDPGSDLLYFMIGLRTLWLNRPNETIETYEPYKQQTPAGASLVWTWGPATAADAHHMLGDYDRELQGLRRAIEHFPDVIPLRTRETRALAAAGLTQEVDDVIDEVLATPPRAGSPIQVMHAAALELLARGYEKEAFRIASRGIDWWQSQPREGVDVYYRHHFATLLNLTEEWTRARDVLEELAQASPDVIAYRGMLGCLAARTGDHGEALRIREELERLDRPYMFGENFCWSARIAALLGERERAVELLRQAFARGYQYGPDLHSDPDLEPLRDYPPFQEMIRPKG